MLNGRCLCFGSSYHPEEQKAKVRPSHPEKGSMIDSDTVPFTKRRIWESCLEDTAIEFSSKKYRSYLTDEVGQWPITRGQVMDPGTCSMGSEAGR